MSSRNNVSVPRPLAEIVVSALQFSFERKCNDVGHLLNENRWKT